jgi:hypothetical protein
MAIDQEVMTPCPQCRFEQPGGGKECRRCGLIFAKYRPISMRSLSCQDNAATPRWLSVAKQWLIEADGAEDGFTLAGRSVVYVFLLWWGASFIRAPLESNYAGESFFHMINLPFHEAGHVFFMPFGRFMMFLGGSLGQILMPLICLLTFLLKTQDPFGASVALWWTAENFMDVAPYINDARALDLMLLGGVTGKETDGHDWENILGMLELLPYDHRLAHLSYDLGILLMVISFAWGGYLLIRQYRRLR